MSGNKQVFTAALNAADHYRWESQWAEAAREYQRALAEFPEDATARGGLGFCYMQTKQWQQALNEYEYTLQRDPGNVIALSKTAELYGILNRRDDAYRAYLHLADLYSQAGQGARAEAAWQKAVQLSPGNPEPHERLATYYFGKKEIVAMIQERLAAAQGYLLRNEPGLARMQCEEVLRVDATNTQAQQLLTQILRGPHGEQRSSSGTLQWGANVARSATDTMGSGMPTGSQSHSAYPPSGPLAHSSGPMTDTTNTANTATSGNLSGGNTGIMGNMGSAGNYGGVSNSGPSTSMAGSNGGMSSAPRKRITASQVTGVLKQTQTFQTQGRFNDAIDLCEQILESGFDRPDARYFLGWLYQEQQRWDDAIRQFQMLLNDPDYALSCYYALGQCYRARGDLRTATIHFDEAVDRVNLDALTVEESDQLVQLCQEAAEAHRMLGEQEQALTVYNALLGFLRSRGWNDKVAQVEFMLQQAQNAPAPARPVTPPTNTTRALPPEQTMQQPPRAPVAPTSQSVPDAATMAFNVGNIANGPAIPPSSAAQQQPPMPPVTQGPPIQNGSNAAAELPDWLTGILNDEDKTQVANKTAQPPAPAAQAMPSVSEQPTIEQRVPGNVPPAPQTEQTFLQTNAAPASPSWLTEGAKPTNTTPSQPLEQPTAAPVPPVATPASAPAQPVQPVQPIQPLPPEPVQTGQVAPPAYSAPAAPSNSVAATPPAPPVQQPEPGGPTAPVAPAQQPTQLIIPEPATTTSNQQVYPSVSAPAPIPTAKPPMTEDLLSQMAGDNTNDEALKQVAEAVLASTAALPENSRLQVVRSMQDIQKYINHGLLTSATEECLRVIDMAPQYLDVHQVLCEIYIRQGKVEQAITKYGILVDTYIANGRVEDAIAIYRRILQLEPNNLPYRTRLITLLSTQGSKEDLLRERTLVAESYLRLGYMDRALTELEQALQESPTSVPTRLNYALALQKLGRPQQAVAEYQRVLQIDPRNLTALVRWHISMIISTGTSRATSLEVLNRIRWQLRGEGQKYYDTVVREYIQASDTYPNNADVQYALGQIHQQSGTFEKALASYDLATRDSALEVLARVGAAQCLLAQGKPEAGINQLEMALQSVRRPQSTIDPTIWASRPRAEGEEHKAPEVEISLLLAKAYERTGRLEQQQAILRQLKQSKASYDEVTSTMAEISARQGDIEGAIQEYFELAHHYRNNRQTDNALNVLNEMVRLAPQDPRAHSTLADLYVSRGQLDEGIAELRLLADIHLRRNQMEEAASALERIGNIYANTGDNEAALANLRRAADLNPNSMDLLREVVGYCLQLGRYQDAVRYQTTIAHHYFNTQQVKESVAALQQLITIDKNNYEAYDLLGQTYQSVGEYEQASRVYKNLARINPDSSVARERLATLQELRPM